jgi:hypothetical protein
MNETPVALSLKEAVATGAENIECIHARKYRLARKRGQFLHGRYVIDVTNSTVSVYDDRRGVECTRKRTSMGDMIYLLWVDGRQERWTPNQLFRHVLRLRGDFDRAMWLWTHHRPAEEIRKTGLNPYTLENVVTDAEIAERYKNNKKGV